MARHVQLGVLASGGGSNYGAIQAAIDAGKLDAEVAVVVSNNSSAGVLERARSRGIPALHISGKTHADEAQALTEALRAARCDVVVLAGYMKRVAPELIAAFDGEVLNIHPGPLPEFGGHGMYGHRVHQAVLAAGAKHSGPTVHLVDGEYDRGPVLAHEAVRVLPDDTPESLAARVLAAEHELYWRTIAARYSAR